MHPPLGCLRAARPGPAGGSNRQAPAPAQVRLLALEVVDELFGRSKHFRGLLAARFTHFLELVVGYKGEAPLPPPPAAAVALRARALEVLERWHAAHGAKYKQVCA